MIQPIVEGHGEVLAVPILLRRLLGALGLYQLEVPGPIRLTRTQLTEQGEFLRGLRLARNREATDGVLVLFDLDNDCARDVAPVLRAWATEAFPDLPCAVVLARREYEAWFLAAIDSLRAKRGIRTDATFTGDPEARRGAKELLRKHMTKGAAYQERADQPALSAAMDFGLAYQRASSFRKLVRELCRILTELGYEPVIPPAWNA